MGSDELFEQEYEKLNDAILKAIVSSVEIQEILIKLKNQEEINDTSVLNLFLSLDELYEMISEKSNQRSCVYKSEPEQLTTLKNGKNKEKNPAPLSKNGDFIDGKPLSLNEVLFENFCQGKFNEEAWKKKARIRL